jgi:hypothetical protein
VTPNEAEVVAAVESELRLRGRPFSRDSLLCFIASCWPLVLDDPDARRWADAFLEAGPAAVPD